VRAQELGRLGPVEAALTVQALEEAHQPFAGDPGAREHLDADAVGLALVVAREVDPFLGQAGHAGGERGARQMALGDVGDLVGEDPGELRFALGEEDQPRMHAHVAARRGEGVHLPVAHHEEGELRRGAPGSGHQARAQPP